MTLEYGSYAFYPGKARLHARTQMHMPKRPGIHTHTHTHTRTLARTHTQICNTYCLSTATMIRERASMLRCAALPVLFVAKNSHPGLEFLSISPHIFTQLVKNSSLLVNPKGM
jgi:hypothetical protein